MATLSIELNYCTFGCKNCTSRFTCKTDMDLQLIKEKIISAINGFNIKFENLAFTSGEPIIYLDVVEPIVNLIKPNLLVLLSTLEYKNTINNLNKLIKLKNNVGVIDIVVTLNLKTSHVHYKLHNINNFLTIVKELSKFNIKITPKVMINENSNKIFEILDIYNINNRSDIFSEVLYAFECGYEYDFTNIKLYNPKSYNLLMHRIDIDNLYTLFIDDDFNISITNFIESITNECYNCEYVLFCPYKLYNDKPICSGGVLDDKAKSLFLQKRR